MKGSRKLCLRIPPLWKATPTETQYELSYCLLTSRHDRDPHTHGHGNAYVSP